MGPRWLPQFVAACGFLLHLQLGVAYSYAVLRPHFQLAFSLDAVWSSFPFSALLLGYTAGMVFGGTLSDRYGPRGIGVAGVLLFAGGFGLASFATDFWTLLASYGAMCGLGTGLAYMAAVTSAVRWYPQARGAATGAVVLGFGLSGTVLAPVLHSLTDAHGWRTAMQTMALAFLALGLPLALGLKVPAKSAYEETAGGSAAGEPKFRLLWLGWALALTPGLAWLGHLPELASEMGFDAKNAALLVSAIALANGLVRPLLGALGDRFGRLKVLAFASVLAAGTLALLALHPPQPLVWLAGMAFGACFAAWLVNMAPVSAEAFQSKSLGANYGWMFTSYGAGALLGPPLVGWSVHATGTHTAALLGSALLLAMSAALFARSNAQ